MYKLELTSDERTELIISLSMECDRIKKLLKDYDDIGAAETRQAVKTLRDDVKKLNKIIETAVQLEPEKPAEPLFTYVVVITFEDDNIPQVFYYNDYEIALEMYNAFGGDTITLYRNIVGHNEARMLKNR